MASAKAERTRHKILDTTRKLITEHGVGYLSIDKVCAAAGISKGAFLYHFKTKKDLFHALVEDYVAHLDERLESNIEKYAGYPEPLVMGYAAWYKNFDKDDGGWASLGVALLALHIHEPEALEPFKNWYGRLFERIRQSSLATPRLLTAIMAFEGFFFTHKMGFDALDDKTKEETWKFITEQLAPQPKNNSEA